MMSSDRHFDYTFENYIVGESNHDAYELISSAVQLPAIRNFPIYIYGKSGLGKSHLLQAAAGYAIGKNSKTRVTYTTMEVFCADVISMLKHHTVATFKLDYDFVDLLIIDDVQFLEDKPTFQEMFLKTFAYMEGRNKRIILACNKSAADLSIENEVLAEKLESCLAAEIVKPDYDMRVEILMSKALSHNLDIEDEEIKKVLRMIAKYVSDDMGKMAGALNRLVSMSRLLKSEIDMELAEKILLEM